ncbi:phosphatidylinositol mannoside acyltransferase [Luteipulveratus sp. YIM 133132]|uniref:phosphatidylinositol mannoside acyltransferase n=1 Tax=Luteipulveratus flavus TaxID=3031728 RepID=UPI0023B1DF7D|nr:phosphatidylinositol mannoside acyltransferase [Luteipulveratus sp. YIM 133132]MDE9364430.1 phosphatidylinositol mannoside acyltransferase [Luteipulveratus sp. YIM 133132]
MLDLAGNLTLAGYRTGWALVRRLPERLAYAAFDRIADAMYMRGGKHVTRMRSNYAKVRPELSENDLEDLVRAGMRSYLRYWCDSFRLSTLTPEQLAPRVRLVGDEDARAVLAQGRSLVLFLGHLGNWDTCGAWATTHFAPVTTVAERLKPEELFDEFLEFRESLGMRIIPLTGGDDPFRELVRAARDGAFIPLLGDRDLTKRGVTVQLCGHEAKVAAGPAALALTAGAALYALGVHYERRADGSGYDVVATFGDRVEAPESGTSTEKIRAMTQQCVDDLGVTIREHTEDWHMMQRVFTDDLDERGA